MQSWPGAICRPGGEYCNSPRRTASSRRISGGALQHGGSTMSPSGPLADFAPPPLDVRLREKAAIWCVRRLGAFSHISNLSACPVVGHFINGSHPKTACARSARQSCNAPSVIFDFNGAGLIARARGCPSFGPYFVGREGWRIVPDSAPVNSIQTTGPLNAHSDGYRDGERPKRGYGNGIDPDYRCPGAAVWRRRILWSQPRVLVIR